MQQTSNTAYYLYWPEMSNTLSIIALVLAVVIFIFGYFTGARTNRTRIYLSIALATIIGAFTMPVIVKVGKFLGLLDKKPGIVFLLTVLMLFIAAIATNIYEIITITARDIGLPTRE